MNRFNLAVLLFGLTSVAAYGQHHNNSGHASGSHLSHPGGGHIHPAPVVHPQPSPVYHPPMPVANNGQGGGFNLTLPNSVNTGLAQIYDSGKVGPKTQNAIATLLEGNGENLTPSQIGYLRGAIEQNNSLSPAQKATLATALQRAKEAKEKMNGGGNGPLFPLPSIDDSPTIVINQQPVYVPDTTPIYVPQQIEAPVETPAAAPVQYGMQITQLADNGPADQARLRMGDVILAVGGQRVQSFDELVNSLNGSSGATEIVYLEGQTGRTLRSSIVPQNGKIGVAVESIELN